MTWFRVTRAWRLAMSPDQTGRPWRAASTRLTAVREGSEGHTVGDPEGAGAAVAVPEMKIMRTEWMRMRRQMRIMRRVIHRLLGAPVVPDAVDLFAGHIAAEGEAATVVVATATLVAVTTVTTTTTMVTRRVHRRGGLTLDDPTGHNVRAAGRRVRGSRDHPPPHAGTRGDTAGTRDAETKDTEMRDVVGGVVVVVVGEVVEVEDRLEEEDPDLRTVEIITEMKSQMVKEDQHVDQIRVIQRVKLLSE